MLHVTPEARTELHVMLQRALAVAAEVEPAPPDVPDMGFRLIARGAQLGLALDAPREGDRILEEDGRTLLLVDTTAADLLGDVTLDVVETADGTRLTIRD